ncbi:hypothetical protein AAHC03_020745 [Spirometra sp. Aus1]
MYSRRENISHSPNFADCSPLSLSRPHLCSCGCGRLPAEHAADVQLEAQIYLAASQATSAMDLHKTQGEPERWQVRTHTREVPITAYGTVEFQGGPHATKARVSHSFLSPFLSSYPRRHGNLPTTTTRPPRRTIRTLEYLFVHSGDACGNFLCETTPPRPPRTHCPKSPRSSHPATECYSNFD